MSDSDQENLTALVGNCALASLSTHNRGVSDLLSTAGIAGERSGFPIFPLGNVLFPAGRLSLRIFEPRYLEMTERCIREGSEFGVNLIRGGFEVGSPAIPFEIGCTARILEWEKPREGLYSIIAQGGTVFRIRRRRHTGIGLIVADVLLHEPADPVDLPDRHSALGELLRRLMGTPNAGQFPQPARFNDAAWIGFRLAELLPIAPERKQSLLEIADPAERLDRVAAFIDELRRHS